MCGEVANVCYDLPRLYTVTPGSYSHAISPSEIHLFQIEVTNGIYLKLFFVKYEKCEKACVWGKQKFG